MVDFTSLEVCLAIAMRYVQGGESDEPALTELLELTAGKSTDPLIIPPTTIYRPYFAAALFIEQSLSFQRLEAADNAKFRDLRNMINGLKGLQARTDRAIPIDVPPGFEVYGFAPIHASVVVPTRGQV